MSERGIFYEQLDNTKDTISLEDVTKYRENFKKGLYRSTVNNSDEENFQTLIQDLLRDAETYQRGAKLTMMYVQVKDIPPEDKDKMNILFFRALLHAHDYQRNRTEDSIRKNLDWKTAKEIAESVEPGIVARIMAKGPMVTLDQGMDRFKRSMIGSWIVYILSKYWNVLSLYLDFIRDCLLFGSLAHMISGSDWFAGGSLFDLSGCFLSEFPHQLLWLLLFSILFPVLTCAINVAMNPTIFLGYESYYDDKTAAVPAWMKWTFLPFGLALCPTVPGFLTNARDVERENTTVLLQQSTGLANELEDIRNRIKFRRKIERKILTFKEVELIVEVTIQSMIQLIMILSNQSLTRTEDGLDNVFKIGEPGFGSTDPNITITTTSNGPKAASLNNTTLLMLIASLLWSLKTALTTYVRLHEDQQQYFLRTKSKIIVGLRGFIAWLNSIFSFLVFFSTVLGLFDLLGHYAMEARLFAVPINSITNIPEMDNTTVVPSLVHNHKYTFNEVYRYLTYGSDKIDSLDSKSCCPVNQLAGEPNDTSCAARNPDINYCDGHCPRPKIYTMIPLGWTYALFLAIIVLQLCVIFITKIFTNKKFNKVKLPAKLWHSLKCVLISDAFNGWDEDLDDSIEDMKGKFDDTKWEITVGSFINCFFNMLKVAPIPVAAIHAYDRQILMQDSLGTFPDEDQSILLLYLFMGLYIPACCIVSLVEWRLMMIYQDKFHPWTNILASQEPDPP